MKTIQGRNFWSILVALVALITGVVAAHGAQPTIRCAFGGCSAEIIPDRSLEVTCESKSVYKGPYSLNTDFRTIRIESSTADGPRIMTQSLPTSAVPSKAVLFLSRKNTDGACWLD